MPSPTLVSRALLAAALLGGAATRPAEAQVVRYGVLSEEARAGLVRSWSENPKQSERAFCVRRARIAQEVVRPGAIDTIIRVMEVRPAEVREAGPNYALFECPPGTPELHTHPPASCPNDDPKWCTAGGPDAYSCQPSRGDYEKLARRGDPYAIIQCGRTTFRFYYPSEFLAAARAVADTPGVTRRPNAPE